MATTTPSTKSSSKGVGGALVSALTAIVLPRRSAKGGTSSPGTYNPSSPEQVLTLPTYREHLTDIFSTRSSSDSRALIQQLLVQDPDVSAAANAYLTVANTELMAVAYDVNGMIDRPGQMILNSVKQGYEVRNDYSKGFDMRPSFKELSENLRYMLLACGSLPCEMVLNKAFIPEEFRLINPTTLQWLEPQPGVFTPRQKTSDGKEIDLSIPTFFVKFFRRDPTKIYTYSPFVSAINTIAGRQQVINDLYRIMQLTGYPRLEVKVLEDVITRNAPLDIRQDVVKLRQHVSSVLSGISSSLQNIRPDQAFVHTDASEVKMLNDRAPGMSIDISSIIDTLNAQNQAGLRTMATILGRGNSGVNTASVEARIFSMTAEEINQPIADLFSDMLTLAIRLQGSQSRVVCKFRPAEMRPRTELEPQLSMRASRLKADLSLGIIDDDEYHLEMYGRIRPDWAPILSGTNFMPNTNIAAQAAASGGSPAGGSDPNAIDVSKVSPNSDPLGRALTPEGSKSASSNTVKP